MQQNVLKCTICWRAGMQKPGALVDHFDLDAWRRAQAQTGHSAAFGFGCAACSWRPSAASFEARLPALKQAGKLEIRFMMQALGYPVPAVAAMPWAVGWLAIFETKAQKQDV